MKNFSILCFLLFCVQFSSCSTDETINRALFDEQQSDPTASNPDANTVDDNTTDDNTNDNIVEEVIITATETCFIQDIEFLIGEPTKIDCLLDLEGQSVNVPENVILEFDGGDIFNGTLNFSSLGKIDWQLLNSKLIVEGDVMLNPNSETGENDFEFIPERWDIVEGNNLTSDQAENNKVTINNVLTLVSTLIGVNEEVNFSIKEMDAHFKVDGIDQFGNEQADLGIIIPSMFNLHFTDNTFFRMYPNNNNKPCLMYIGFGVENITLEGGNFVGDRDQHDYSSGTTHEWGHLLRVGGARNVKISKANFIDATGDGIDVHSFGHTFSENYFATTDVIIEDNTFERNRRNQISITSGTQVYVRNNEFIDGSIHTNLSNGVAPGFAIDIEAFRSDGIEFEIAEDIYILDNFEKGTRIGAFTIHTGDKITIDGNTLEGHISYSNTIGSNITNNTITALTDSQKESNTAIVAGRTDRYEMNYDNTVTGNTVNGYATGIVVTNTDVVVANNNILECSRGIVLEELTDTEIYNNTIISSRETSTGYSSGAASNFINNVTIYQTDLENTLIDVQKDAFKFVDINEEEEYKDYKIVITKNIVSSKSSSTFSSKGIDFIENTVLEGGIRISNAENILISNNNIRSTLTDYPIRVDSGCEEVTILGNEFLFIDRCIFENNNDGINIVIDDNNCTQIQ